MYRGRFAPSPTGPLHFGSLVAALASFADARANRGEWLLRIEDVDVPRARRDSEADIVATLARYGFAFDRPLERQSVRTPLYAAALDTLVAADLAYPCACSRRDLETAPIGPGGERVYPGTCSTGVPATATSRRERAWRVRAGAARVEFVDRLQGPQAQDLARDVGDFVVRRADGLFAYQFAVVVDDAAQQVTHVVRGADLLSSTPRQIHLQRLLGLPQVSYLHVPVALDAAGEKLSKQTEATALPRDPLPALVAAWRFLDQPPPAAPLRTVDDFWSHALRAWTPRRLPPLAMLPAPPVVAGV